ncbi:MAG: HAD family phosphatase [Lachnospiraceae bacterium]|nr:HAD family phosphatase [Lachnospiraceae bacterium]
MNSKALFMDLDGTLLTDDKQITPGNRLAINKALEQGHRIIIATGRPLASSIIQAEKLGLTGKGCYLIAFNGGILFDMEHQQVIFRSVLPLETVFTIFDEANRRGMHVQTYGENNILVEPRCDNDIIRLYSGRLLMDYAVIPDIRTLKRPPEKVLLIDLHNQEPLLNFREWVYSWGEDQLDMYLSCNEYMEVVEKGLNKGTALVQMEKLLHIPHENTIAAGDAANDLNMLLCAHTGVAMCNGDPMVKEQVSYVTERDNNHDGIAEIIERFILS